MMKVFAAASFTSVAILALAGCGGEAPSEQTSSAPAERGAAIEEIAAEDVTSLDAIGEGLVKLSLGVGEHDRAFVDAYHGPDDWAANVKANPESLDALEAQARALLTRAQSANAEDPSARGAMLEKLIAAALMRIQMTGGETFSFDEETKTLYDAVAPAYSLAEFDKALAQIDALLPGEAPLNERVDAFRSSLAIPQDKLRAVFDAAIAECRKRTLAHYGLPANERFTLEFVTDKPWSGYNWYQGDFESLIQVNQDFPIVIDRAVDLGCHEGYPGHHTWNAMIERDFVDANGWIEYSLYPLFSPLSLIAEGTANYGIALAFPGTQKIEFERDVLFPLAGLDPAKAETLHELNELRKKLSHVRNHIAREYLDGRITRQEAVEMAMTYRLESAERADQSIRFIETYRGYVLNYNLGLDLVDAYIERRVAAGADRWAVFETLLTTPLAASDLVTAE